MEYVHEIFGLMTKWLVAKGPVLGPSDGGPGIYAFADELLREHGIERPLHFTTDVVHVVREERDEQGFVGSESAGYGWREITNEFTSAIPKQTSGYTYGLPGIEVEWSLVHAKDGQRGFSDLTQCEVRVRTTEEGRACFGRVWERVFGSPPVVPRG